jgi:cell division protein FtsL
MSVNGAKLGKLLMHADIVTKRQVSEAVRKQQNGDKRKLGEILIEMGYVSVSDLTEVVMQQATKATSATEGRKRDTLLQKQIIKSKSKPKEKTHKKTVDAPKELSEDTKFNLSIKTIIACAVAIASLVGIYYMLVGEISMVSNAVYDNEDSITGLEEEIEDHGIKIRDLELKVAKLVDE